MSIVLTAERKSSHSGPQGGNCVAASNFRKSSHSAAGNCVEAGSFRKSTFSQPYGDCVETGTTAAGVAVRDTQLGADSPVIPFTAAAWRAFTAGLK